MGREADRLVAFGRYEINPAVMLLDLGMARVRCCPRSVACLAGLLRRRQAPQAWPRMGRMGEQGAAPDWSAFRLVDLLRPCGVGARNLRRCRPVLRHGLFGERLERTWSKVSQARDSDIVGCPLDAVRRRRAPLLGLVARQRKIDAKPTVTANVSIGKTTAAVSDWR